MSLRLGLALLVLTGLAVAFGYPLLHQGPFDPLALARDLYAPGTAALLGVALTVLILGSIYEGRQARQEKTWLLRQMRSRDNALALEALEVMRERGWLFGGTLNGARMAGANLQGGYLWGARLRRVNLSGANLASTLLNGADLRGAYLEGTYLAEAILRQANLEGAFMGDTNLRAADLQGANLKDVLLLTDAQMARSYRMRGATMPTGRRYDGRYRLAGDLADLENQRIKLDDVLDVSRWYGVKPGEYAEGQVWAEHHLAEVLAEISPETSTKEADTPSAPAGPPRGGLDDGDENLSTRVLGRR